MRRLVLLLGLLALTAIGPSAALAVHIVGPAPAGPAFSQYTVFGNHGVFIGAGSNITGPVGANDGDWGHQGNRALGLNGGAQITGDARIASENIWLANNADITGTLTRLFGSTLSTGAGATVGTDNEYDTIAATPLPPATNLAPVTCPTGGPDHTSLGNNATLNLIPGTYGDIQAGGGFDLNLTGAGDYYFDSIRTGNGLTINVTTPGNTRVFVCETARLGAGATVLPLTLTPSQFYFEAQAAPGPGALANAFSAGGGSDWIGNVFTPNGRIHFGSGSGPTTFNGSLRGQFVDIEHGVVNTPPNQPGPPEKSGYKFHDLNGDGVWDANEPGLNGWTINLYDATQTNLLNSDITHDDSLGDPGFYSFILQAGVTYVVCEVPQPPLVQTFPAAAGGNIVLCQAEGTLGYQVTLQDGQVETGNNFGNWQEPEQLVCQKPTVINEMNAIYIGNGGPDITVRTWVPLNESIQDAVDNATDTNGDGYIIVMVIANSDGSLGGTANQKVVIDKDYGENEPFALFGCSVKLSGGGTDPALWVKDTANSKNIAANGRTTDIFVMDLHGVNSAVGAQADGQYRYLRTVQPTDNVVGIKVLGNDNTIHNSDANDNSGDGVFVQGNANLLEDLDAFENGGDGIEVIGNSNVLDNNDVGDRNKGNGGDGIRVSGDDNDLVENAASANTGDGFDISGTGNELEGNKSNDGASGGDKENGGPEYRFANVIVDSGGNKKDNVAFTDTAIGAYE